MLRLGLGLVRRSGGAEAVAGEVNAKRVTMTLTPYAATVSKSVNVSASAVGLTVTPMQAAVGSVANVAANAEALTLTTYQATVAEASITISSATYDRGAAGVAPEMDIDGTVTNTTANYTLYWASRDAANPALSKTNIENGTGNAIDNGTIVSASLPIQGDIDLATSLTSDAIDVFIRDSSGTPVESDVSSITGVTYDAVAPGFSSAEIGNVDDTSLIITLTKATYESGTLAPADFDVQVAGSGATVSAVSLTSTTTIDITLSTAVTSGQSVTVALLDGSVLVGVDAEAVATWTAQTVTNNVSSAWDFEDDFTGYSNGDVLNAQSAYAQVYRNNASAVLEVSTTPTVQIHSDGTQYPYEIVAHTGRTYTDDQRAEIDVETGPGSDDYTVAVGVRLDSVNNEGYVVEWFDGSSTSLQVKKITGIGTLSNLGSAITITAPTLPFSLAMEARDNGANVDLEVFLDGVSQGTVTDTSSVYTDGDAGFGQYMNADDSASQGDAAGAVSDFRARDA